MNGAFLLLFAGSEQKIDAITEMGAEAMPLVLDPDVLSAASEKNQES